MAEVCFAGYCVDRGTPVVRHGIADIECYAGRDMVGIDKPVQVCLGELNHFRDKIGTVDIVTKQRRFLEKHACPAKWVKDSACFDGSEIDHHAGEFWGKHTNKGIAFWAALVAGRRGRPSASACGILDGCPIRSPRRRPRTRPETTRGRSDG